MRIKILSFQFWTILLNFDFFKRRKKKRTKTHAKKEKKSPSILNKDIIIIIIASPGPFSALKNQIQFLLQRAKNQFFVLFLIRIIKARKNAKAFKALLFIKSIPTPECHLIDDCKNVLIQFQVLSNLIVTYCKKKNHHVVFTQYY